MNAEQIIKLREERARLTKQARDVIEAAEKESRDINAEERQRYDKIFEDIGKLKERVTLAEKVLSEEREQEQPQPRKVPPGKPGADDPESREAADREGVPQQRYGASATEFRYLVAPDRITKPVERVIEFRPERATAEYQAAFRRYLQTKQIDQRLADQVNRRDLQADNQISGGGVVAAEQFVANLVKFVDDSVYIRGLATVIQVGRADSLGAPSWDTDPSDADWSAEVPAALTPDTSAVTGKRELHPWICTKLVKVSRKLLRVSAIDLESFVRARLGYKLALTHEKAFLTGTGANRPLGVFTASADGVTTARDVSTGNTTTSMTGDGLINAKMSLKAQYRRRSSCRWMFHRDGVSQVSKLKDAIGQYLWRVGLVVGEPDMLLGHPIMESEYAPNTFTTGQYVGIIGDWSNYWIADSLDMEILRLDERYSDTLQVGFQLMAATDGMPTLAEAWARVKLA